MFIMGLIEISRATRAVDWTLCDADISLQANFNL